MDLSLIISFGILLSYLNFLIHDAEIFSYLRIRFETWLKIQTAKGFDSAKWAFKLYSCNLCNNFWIALMICAAFQFPLNLPLTSPVIAFIVGQWMKK